MNVGTRGKLYLLNKVERRYKRQQQQRHLSNANEPPIFRAFWCNEISQFPRKYVCNLPTSWKWHFKLEQKFLLEEKVALSRVKKTRVKQMQ